MKTGGEHDEFIQVALHMRDGDTPNVVTLSRDKMGSFESPKTRTWQCFLSGDDFAAIIVVNVLRHRLEFLPDAYFDVHLGGSCSLVR